MSIPAPIHGAIAGPGARPPRLRRPLAALALAGVSLLAPVAVLAHAELASVSPTDGSTVEGSPLEIVMTFSQRLDPARSSIRLVDAGGTVVAQDSTVDADRTTMRLAIPAPLESGTYTTRWTSFSADDGEQDRGTTTFTVAAAAASASSLAPSTGPTTGLSPAPSAGTSAGSSLAPTGSSTGGPTAPASSATDAIIPIVAALVVLAGLGLWLLRGRGRGR